MRRELRLTETGEAVFSYTQRIFALADEMHSVVRDIQGLHSGKPRLARQQRRANTSCLG